MTWHNQMTPPMTMTPQKTEQEVTAKSERLPKVALNGWVNLDKPEGIGSTPAIAKVKRALNAKKLGHTGTLDPLASGVLPLALGEATKATRFLMDATKDYRFTVLWGESTTTDDREGEVMETSAHRPSATEIEQALAHFTGEIQQIPPQFSALKVDGQRAYDLARDKKPVQLKARPVMIHALQLIGTPDADHAELFVTCGKGTYVRSLARDLAAHLGTRGHASAIRRTRVGPFREEDAKQLDFFVDFCDQKRHIADPKEFITPIEAGLDDIPVVLVNRFEAGRLKNGIKIPFDIRRCGVHALPDETDPSTPLSLSVLVETHAKPIGFCVFDGRFLKPDRMLNL